MSTIKQSCRACRHWGTSPNAPDVDAEYGWRADHVWRWCEEVEGQRKPAWSNRAFLCGSFEREKPDAIEAREIAWHFPPRNEVDDETECVA